MAFIDTLPESDIDAAVRQMYERQQSHYGYVPNYAKVFCYRPELMGLWAQLLSGIKKNMDLRQFELATFAAANVLRSTLCSLAHGRKLTEYFSDEDVKAMVRGEIPASLSAADAALMDYARKVARDATSVTAGDVERLKSFGFSDADVFDIAAAAAARAFFTKVLDGLGVEADAAFRRIDADFRKAMTVGRPIDFKAADLVLQRTA
jgi:uncharacterized peroxidase-related enzyme